MIKGQNYIFNFNFVREVEEERIDINWGGGENLENYFLSIFLIEDWMSVAMFTKYLLKALAISCGSV